MFYVVIEIINIHKETLISDLTLCEQEHNLIFLDTCLLIQGLDICLEVSQ